LVENPGLKAFVIENFSNIFKINPWMSWNVKLHLNLLYTDCHINSPNPLQECSFEMEDEPMSLMTRTVPNHQRSIAKGSMLITTRGGQQPVRQVGNLDIFVS
jgi:hypothetical protein